jgi:hypothetical protein
MNTLSDIQSAAHTLGKSLDEAKASLSMELFTLYDSSEDIQKLAKNVENMEGGDYSIDDMGILIYSVAITKDILSLPEIKDYLTQDYAYIAGHRNDYRLAQTCGEFISVSNYHDRNSYFVYDHETREAIIENRKDWMSDQYVRAMIEKHQRIAGVFVDVVKTDCYGGYDSHFETLGEALSDAQLDELITSLEPKNEEEE